MNYTMIKKNQRAAVLRTGKSKKKGPASGGTNQSFLQILNWEIVPQLLGSSVYGAKSGGNCASFSRAVSFSKSRHKEARMDSYLVAVKNL